MNNSISKKIEELKRTHRIQKEQGIYAGSYLTESLKEDFDKLKDGIHQEYKAELTTAKTRLAEIEVENDKIIPQTNSIDELLRRQQIELEISLMTDDDFEEFAKNTLLDDHEYFDELRLFSELRTRGNEDAAMKVKEIREQRLRTNDEYMQLNTKANMLGVFIGFENEIAYEEDGKVHYVSYQDLEREALKV